MVLFRFRFFLINTNLIYAQILNTNKIIEAIKAQLQSRVTQEIEMNRQITEINDLINLSYCHLQTFTPLQTRQTNTHFQFESHSMANDVRLNAEFDLHPNRNDKELWPNYERHYGRRNYTSEFLEERRGRLIRILHEAPIIFNQTKLDNRNSSMFNIFLIFNLNYFI